MGTPRVLGGRYELGQRIGEGGFGAVHEARDGELQRRVAVKLLDPARAAAAPAEVAQLRERFHREAVATASIVHPNVVTIFDVGIANDVYIVMELMHGRSLAEELERWPTGMPPERILPLFLGALRGLAAGHAIGIVHKDLKPENLFIDQADSSAEMLRIIDFGTARVLHEHKLTATGKLVGTPRYLAPEYIQHLEVSPALDVYQMGLILVEVLSAMPCVPRRLDLVSCCQRHVDGTLEIPAGLRLGEIGAVIGRALAIDPSDRYANAGEFADALESIRPQTVSTAAPGADRPTPRLGVKPLVRGTHTQPMHGGASVVRKDPPPVDSPATPKKARRHPRTGPTKRLGPSRDIVEQLASLQPDALEPARETRTRQPAPTTTLMDLDEQDPLDRRRRLIYGLVASAIIAVLLTATVLLSSAM